MAQSEFAEIRDFHKRISEEAESLIKKVPGRHRTVSTRAD